MRQTTEESRHDLKQSFEKKKTRKSDDLVIPCQNEKKLWIQEFQTFGLAEQH